MAEIKSVSDIVAKYARVTPQRAEDYRNGVAAPKRSWMAAAAAAESAYEQGVQGAISRKAFGRGVRAAGDQTWQGRSASVGVDRWGPGIQAGVSNYEKGFAPYAEVIKSVSLPPAYPKGDPRNYARVQAIGEALRKRKTGGK